MFTKIPNIYTLTSSNEEGLTKLNAFDMCLLKSNIGNMVRWGMEQRGYEIEKIISISSQHIVQNTGCAFACVILGWDK